MDNKELEQYERMKRIELISGIAFNAMIIGSLLFLALYTNSIDNEVAQIKKAIKPIGNS